MFPLSQRLWVYLSNTYFRASISLCSLVFLLLQQGQLMEVWPRCYSFDSLTAVSNLGAGLIVNFHPIILFIILNGISSSSCVIHLCKTSWAASHTWWIYLGDLERTTFSWMPDHLFSPREEAAVTPAALKRLAVEVVVQEATRPWWGARFRDQANPVRCSALAVRWRLHCRRRRCNHTNHICFPLTIAQVSKTKQICGGAEQIKKRNYYHICIIFYTIILANQLQHKHTWNNIDQIKWL